MVRKLWASATAPASPATGEVYLDISVTPPLLLRYNGATWDIVGAIQQVSATDKLLGRVTAGAGSVEEIPCTAAGRALLAGAGTLPWTPIYTSNAGSAGALAYTSEGDYTKIGQLVIVHGSIILSNKGSWTGTVMISGLPFVSSKAVFAGMVGCHNVTYDGQMFTYIPINESYIIILISKTAAAISLLGCSGVVNTSEFNFTATYITSS